ncbi:MAG: hypothetical protein ACYDAJ_09030 [Nitrosotalea sp.]
MNNLVQCIRCKQNLIREEYEDHICSSGKFKGVRNIEVIQWHEVKNECGERIAFGLGSDGYNYEMREVKEGFIELDHTNRNFTDKKPTADYTGPLNWFCVISVGSPLCQNSSGKCLYELDYADILQVGKVFRLDL